MINLLQFAKGFIQLIYCKACKRTTEHRAHGQLWVCTKCGRSTKG